MGPSPSRDESALARSPRTRASVPRVSRSYFCQELGVFGEVSVALPRPERPPRVRNFLREARARRGTRLQ